MAYEQKDFTGSLFKNDKKESDNHPNAKGSAKMGGVEYWVAAWTKKDKNGNPWQSLSFKPKDNDAQRERSQAKPTKSARDLSDMDDDVPFADPYKGRLCYVV
jgi:hypothetical protein